VQLPLGHQVGQRVRLGRGQGRDDLAALGDGDVLAAIGRASTAEVF